MKRILLLPSLVIFFSVSCLAQPKGKNALPPGVEVKIVEDYSSTYGNSDMWRESKYNPYRKIENGMYVSTAKDPFEPSLEFNSPNQLYFCYRSDMEFVIVTEGQTKSDFIHVRVVVGEEGSREFNYNMKGEWNISGFNGSPVFKKGKVKLESTSNKVKVLHRNDTLKYYFNDEYLGDHVLEKTVQIWWKKIRIFQGKDKGTLALDKVTLIGYYDKLVERDREEQSKAWSEEAAKRKKEEEEKANAAALAKAEEERKWNEKVAAYKKDKMAQELNIVFDKYDDSNRNTVKKLLSILKSSMETNDKTEFINRRFWPLYATNDLPKGIKLVRDEVESYRAELGKLGLKPGENKMYDKLIPYLESILTFSGACEGWAEDIGDKTLTNDGILESLTRLENASGPMRDKDWDILAFTRLYKAGNGLK